MKAPQIRKRLRAAKAERAAVDAAHAVLAKHTKKRAPANTPRALAGAPDGSGYAGLTADEWTRIEAKDAARKAAAEQIARAVALYDANSAEPLVELPDLFRETDAELERVIGLIECSLLRKQGAAEELEEAKVLLNKVRERSTWSIKVALEQAGVLDVLDAQGHSAEPRAAAGAA